MSGHQAIPISYIGTVSRSNITRINDDQARWRKYALQTSGMNRLGYILSHSQSVQLWSLQQISGCTHGHLITIWRSNVPIYPCSFNMYIYIYIFLQSKYFYGYRLEKICCLKVHYEVRFVDIRVVGFDFDFFARLSTEDHMVYFVFKVTHTTFTVDFCNSL